MNRAQKAVEIESLKDRFAQSVVTILADYKGLSVAKLTELRQKLKEQDASFKIVKNRLAKIAVKDTPREDLTASFVGTTAMAVSDTNPVGPARVLVDFAKDNDQLKLKSGYLDGKIIGVNDIKHLASLPSKEELIARLMGSLLAPASNLVNVLSQIPRQVVNVLSAIRDQKDNN